MGGPVKKPRQGGGQCGGPGGGIPRRIPKTGRLQPRAHLCARLDSVAAGAQSEATDERAQRRAC